MRGERDGGVVRRPSLAGRGAGGLAAPVHDLRHGATRAGAEHRLVLLSRVEGRTGALAPYRSAAEEVDTTAAVSDHGFELRRTGRARSRCDQAVTAFLNSNARSLWTAGSGAIRSDRKDGIGVAGATGAWASQASLASSCCAARTVQRPTRPRIRDARPRLACRARARAARALWPKSPHRRDISP